MRTVVFAGPSETIAAKDVRMEWDRSSCRVLVYVPVVGPPGIVIRDGPHGVSVVSPCGKFMLGRLYPDLDGLFQAAKEAQFLLFESPIEYGRWLGRDLG